MKKIEKEGDETIVAARNLIIKNIHVTSPFLLPFKHPAVTTKRSSPWAMWRAWKDINECFQLKFHY